MIIISGCGKSEGEDSALVKMVNSIHKAKSRVINSQIASIENAINSYFSDNNEYPEILDQLIPHYLRIKSHIIDPWGTPFTLENDEDLNLFLISAGRDTIFGTKDDIKRRM